MWPFPVTECRGWDGDFSWSPINLRITLDGVNSMWIFHTGMICSLNGGVPPENEDWVQLKGHGRKWAHLSKSTQCRRILKGGWNWNEKPKLGRRKEKKKEKTRKAWVSMRDCSSSCSVNEWKHAVSRSRCNRWLSKRGYDSDYISQEHECPYNLVVWHPFQIDKRAKGKFQFKLD